MEAIGAIKAVQAGVNLVKSLSSHRKTARNVPFSNHMQQSIADQTLTRFDKNGDGVLSRTELSLDRNLFKQLDLNRDGVLDKNEIQTGAKTLEKYHAHENSFHRLDANENDLLSPNESGLSQGKFGEVDSDSNNSIQLAEWLDSGVSP
jgi:hypothetical protein